MVRSCSDQPEFFQSKRKANGTHAPTEEEVKRDNDVCDPEKGQSNDMRKEPPVAPVGRSCNIFLLPVMVAAIVTAAKDFPMVLLACAFPLPGACRHPASVVFHVADDAETAGKEAHGKEEERPASKRGHGGVVALAEAKMPVEGQDRLRGEEAHIDKEPKSGKGRE